jgi:single-stranded-DNA-specific exonuclease
MTKGSARSIHEFHITEALDQCADLLVRHGGHSAAAGFTLKNEDLPAFQERLLQIARKSLDGADLKPTLSIDGEVNLKGVRPDLVEKIATLQPFGYSNPTPHFLSRNLRVKHSKAIGQDAKHLRLVLHDGKQDWSAVAFQQGYWANKLTPAQTIDVVYSLEFNEWNGERFLQLNIKDLRPA